jgi:hypothetical protein
MGGYEIYRIEQVTYIVKFTIGIVNLYYLLLKAPLDVSYTVTGVYTATCIAVHCQR